MIGKRIKEKFDSEITLANNEIKDIIKVIKNIISDTQFYRKKDYKKLKHCL